MESGIGDIFLILLSNYGIVGAVIIIAVILAIFYGIIIGFKYLVKFIINKFENRKKIKLKNHQFFNDLDFLVNHKLKDVKTSCIIRKKIYVDIMKIRIDNLKKIFSNFIKEDINGMTSKELYHRVLLALDDANTAAITGAVSEGVPIFVLDSMNEKRKMINKLYYNAIKGYCYNYYIYDNNTERMYAIL
jgi:predicted lactoylglutathione lyase